MMRSSSSVVLGGGFAEERDDYQPPILTSKVLSTGLLSHSLIKPSNAVLSQAELLLAQKRKSQAAYKALLDADRVASIPVNRRPIPLPSPTIEATGFMVGRQRVEEEPLPKHVAQQQWKAELTEAATRPAIPVDRRPFQHRAYTPKPSQQQLNGLDGLEDEAQAELLRKRAELRARLSVDRQDVIEKLSPHKGPPAPSYKLAPVGGKGASLSPSESKKVFSLVPLPPDGGTGLAVGPDIAAEKKAALIRSAAFQEAVKRERDAKAAALEEENRRRQLMLSQAQAQAQARLQQQQASSPLGKAGRSLVASSSLSDLYVNAEGNTGLLIGGETSDLIRGKSRQVQKRQQQQQYRATLEQQQQQKRAAEEAIERSGYYSLTKPGVAVLDTLSTLGAPDDDNAGPVTNDLDVLDREYEHYAEQAQGQPRKQRTPAAFNLAATEFFDAPTEYEGEGDWA